MKRRNFTLLEVTIASVVLAIAIMALLAAISINFRLQASNKETMLAMNAAQEEINRFLTDTFLFRSVNKDAASLNFSNPPPRFTIPFTVDGLQLQAGDAFAGTTILEGNELPSNSNYPTGISHLLITVRVRWSGVSGNRQIVLYSERFRMFEDGQMQDQ